MFIDRTVLIADDQSTSREQLRDVLRCSGYFVLGECRSSDDALDKFERLLPDVVIIDITLPGTHDALVTIQRMFRTRPNVAIFATGSASQGPVMMEALSMGALDFFLKPFQHRTVHSCLQRNLG
jgi:two-component system, chemotaxis family, chemotaxis protein CheY